MDTLKRYRAIMLIAVTLISLCLPRADQYELGFPLVWVVRAPIREARPRKKAVPEAG
jgi:hypothetical protein